MNPSRSYVALVAAASFAAAGFLGLFLVSGLSAFTVALPAAAFVLGVAVIAVSRPLFLEYAFWVLFLAPLARRLVDYGLGAYTPTSLVIASPLLVGSVAGGVLVADLVRGRVGLGSPFVLPLAGLTFAFAVGLIRNGTVAASYDLLTWGTPIALGYLVASDPTRFPAYWRATRRVLTTGGVALGAYGVVQFILLPPWDAFWMTESGLVTIGRPEPFEVRVFATLNSPGPYGVAMMVSALIGLAGRTGVAAGPALVGLLLSLVRGAWGACVVGVAWAAGQAGPGKRARPLMVLAVAALTAFPALSYRPIADQVQERAETLVMLDEDGSAQTRTMLYLSYGPDRVLTSPLGEGLGALGAVSQLSAEGPSGLDSGLLGVPLVLGLPGMLLYMSGVVALLGRSVLRRQPTQALQTTSAIAVALVAMLVFGNQLIGVGGWFLWTAIGLTLGGRAWHAARPDAPADA